MFSEEFYHFAGLVVIIVSFAAVGAYCLAVLISFRMKQGKSPHEDLSDASPLSQEKTSASSVASQESVFSKRNPFIHPEDY
jgi:hypothetical protein